MFGFFKKKMPNDLRRSCVARGREAMAHTAGQVQGNCFMLDSGVLDFGQQATRDSILNELSDLWDALSKNREQWPQQLQDLFGDAYDRPSTTLHRKAATHLLAGLLKVDVVCRAAEEYPGDRDATSFALHVLSTTMQAYDFILTGKADFEIWEMRPSVDLLPELQYANAFFERATGLR